MEILVIYEEDLKDNEVIVIGLADSIEMAEQLIKNYYGDFKEISKTDIRDSSLEYSKILEPCCFNDKPYRVEITLQWFTLNTI